MKAFISFGLILLLVVTDAWANGMPRQASAVGDTGIRIKELSRLAGAKDNSLVGYGIVAGLAGTGDSVRSLPTLQSVKNLLLRFGVNVPTDQVRSRNVAVVMVTAVLPTFAQPGDKLDVNVTSLGDARSLAGGVLVRTHLEGPDGETYALAQGPLSVGGYKFDLNQNLVQKNHPTVANIPDGATVERSVHTELVTEPGYVQLVLNDPDLTTASRVANSIDEAFGRGRARAMDAARVRVAVAEAERINIVHFLQRLENLYVVPDRRARIVVNERTGTVVSGGDVRISPVTISHGDLKLKITTEFQVSQPGYGGFPAFIVGDDINIQGNSGVRTVVVPKTDIDVQEEQPLNVILPQGATVAELVTALSKVRATPRDIITILQGIKRAGALHAELVIQ